MLANRGGTATAVGLAGGAIQAGGYRVAGNDITRLSSQCQELIGDINGQGNPPGGGLLSGIGNDFPPAANQREDYPRRGGSSGNRNA